MLPVIPCTANMAWFHGCPQLEHQANHFMIAKNKPYADGPIFLIGKKLFVVLP